MNSRKFSLLDSARFLWSVRGELSGTGVRSRLGTLRLAVTRGQAFASRGEGCRILADHNTSKLDHASRVFGCRLCLIDPLTISHLFRYRLLLVCSSFLIGDLREVTVALIHAENFKRVLASKPDIYLWNPYTLIQYAVSERIEVEAVYYLTVAYPPIRRTSRAFASGRAHELMGTPINLREIANQPMTVTSNSLQCVFYPTQLHGLSVLETERQLISLARTFRETSRIPVLIFLHYVDRNMPPELLSEALGDLAEIVTREDSLVGVSSRQISFSASSTIGLEFLSRQSCHFVLANRANSGREVVGDWRWRLEPDCSNVLWSDLKIDAWRKSIRITCPDLAELVAGD